MDIRNILNAKALSELLDAAEEFCQNAIMREDDSECMELKETLEQVTDNDYLTILSSYMSVAEDGDEVIDAICEFVEICRTFAEPETETAEQITKAEFEGILDHCEDVCAVKTCIETEHTINIAEIPLLCLHNNFAVTEKNDLFNIFLPMINKLEDKEKYISDMIANMFFDSIKGTLGEEYVLEEIKRYIPESRNSDKSVKELFREYFCYVVKYKERKPCIYTEFNEHMKGVIVTACYTRLAQEYLCRFEK